MLEARFNVISWMINLMQQTFVGRDETALPKNI